MKNIFFLISLLLTSVTFGQKLSECTEMICDAPNITKFCFGEFKPLNNLPSIRFRVKGPIKVCSKNMYGDNVQHYDWYIELIGSTEKMFGISFTGQDVTGSHYPSKESQIRGYKGISNERLSIIC